ncbi:DUF2461 domain-containing protein [Gelidibacter salicanalis]|uniref:DUF2461 domain-containing protein n=1 Tax=Gelidibacter salicanalis TaxID=291193 RepID=A0A934L014_9FLAO|nr:DUF2461 domain-containing protein [Gelidibacter salicanalis]MBJ7882865.1 DUF2461 domain-containing protein [Gelidibacter salicanalis]
MTKASTFSKDLLEFLKLLQENNDRDWFNEHKAAFTKLQIAAKHNFHTLFEALKMHDDVDRVKIFRIYRDVRFSKNKAPYKTHFSGSFHRKKPDLRGGYYLHIQPNNESFIAVGFWDPSKEDLLRIRKEFEMDDEDIRAIIENKKIKDIWGNLAGDELKTAPKGFDKEHKAIDLIRKKQFIFTKKYTDAEVLSTNFLNDVNGAFQTIRPYFDYMTDVLNTNSNGELLI